MSSWVRPMRAARRRPRNQADRKSTRLNSNHVRISYAVFCLKKKKGRSGACTRERRQLGGALARVRRGGAAGAGRWARASDAGLAVVDVRADAVARRVASAAA